MIRSVVKYGLAMTEVVARHALVRLPHLRHIARQRVRHAPPNQRRIALDTLQEALVRMGISEGDFLLVHSSWAGMRNLEAKPSAVIEMILELIGSSGTLAMPTAPLSIDYGGEALYEIEYTPSSMGLLTESFRRRKDTIRSPCPLATISAHGPLAEQLSRDFREESGNTAYGLGSPYEQLVAEQGKVLVLGIGTLRPLSLLHSTFDCLGDENPIADYYADFTFQVVDGNVSETWHLRRHAARWERYYASIVFSQMLHRAGLVQREDFGGMKVSMLDADAFADWHKPLARDHGWPYWGFPRKVEG